MSAGEAGLRLDRFLALRLSLSRQLAREAIEGGRVSVQGRRAGKGHPLAEGDEVVAHLESTDETPVPEPTLPLVVHHVDEGWVVVEKQAGWPTHPLRPGETGTLANAVVARWPECAEASVDPREGGVTHRLDTPTSGLVAAARNRRVWEDLRAQFSNRTVTRRYLALVEGSYMGPWHIETPIGSRGGSPRRMVATADPLQAKRLGAREAITSVEVLERWEGYTLVQCTISTGVMHQIRVHLAHVGHPVAGDPLYGNPDHPPGIPRLFLHAAFLAFDDPSTGERRRFESPLPADLRGLLHSLPGRH